MSDEKEKSKNNERKKTSALEWLFAVLGLLLVVSVIGYLIYEIVTNEKKPPRLNVKIGEIIANEHGFLVKFKIENTGDENATDVTVEGEATRAKESVEKSDVTIDYVPAHSEKKGGMFFKNDPHDFDFEIHAKGYNEP